MILAVLIELERISINGTLIAIRGILNNFQLV
jgi:hypothetical protein